MFDLQTLMLFIGAVSLLLLTPGPNMAFVVSHGISHGWRGGVAAALGVSAADLSLSVLTATGITGLVAAWPPSFDIIRYCGALYLLWMAWKALQDPAPGAAGAATQTALKAIFLRATLNSLLNPKALLFFIVFLPQFVVPAKGMIAQQLLLLGGLLTLLALAFHIVLGLSGGSISRGLSRSAKYARLQSRILASVLGVLAVRLLLLARPN